MLNNSKLTITDADFNRLETKFDQNNNLIANALNNIFVEIKLIRSDIKSIKIEIKEMRNDFTTKFDKTMGELKAISEDHIVLTYQVSDARENISSNKSRITSVEEKVAF